MTTPNKSIALFGSSVALGFGVDPGQGWSALLKAQVERNGWTLTNYSVVGYDTTRTKAKMEEVLPTLNHKPAVVIVSLSLFNERIFANPQKAYDSFARGIEEILKLIKAINAIPIIGGLYPNNKYKAEHYSLLQRMESALRSREDKVSVWSWLPALDDGQGHWKDGYWLDFAHPNDKGHKAMFDSIPANAFPGQLRAKL